RDQLVFLWSSVSLASVVLVPVGLLGLPEGGVPAAAVPYVIATIVIHAGYFVTLGRAYRHGDFSRVYPIARGLGVALVPVAAVVRDRLALAREWRENWRTIAVASSMNLTSYLLVLFAFRLSKVGYVVAGRELSILFSTLIGSLWLGEAPAPARGRLDRAGGCRLRCARALIQSEGASAAPSEASPGKVARAKARARTAVGPTRGYRRPNASVASSATWRPIASEAVAAGEGALRTWIA